MTVVIQCAGSKQRGGNMKTSGGMPVVFVAQPALAPRTTSHIWARPDDPDDSGTTWRERTDRLNLSGEAAVNGWLPAFQLYLPRIYQRLVDHAGVSNVFILSAGWGLVRASFRLPYYDITFSSAAEPYKRRRKRDSFEDFCHLCEGDDSIVFLGGKDYLPAFCTLTFRVRRSRTVFYRSDGKCSPPNAPGCHLVPFVTSQSTNWHYACANALVEGILSPA